MKSHRESRVEKLEPRTLLSAWSTVDSIPSSASYVSCMAADASGNVYAVGQGATSEILREKLASSSITSWTTVAVLPNGLIPGNGGMAVDGSGDVFITGANSLSHWQTWQLPKGAAAFTLVYDAGAGQGTGSAADASGNIYVVGSQLVSIKRNTGYNAWTVRKGVYSPSTGKWSFTTIDQVASSSGAQAVAAVVRSVNGVPATSIYVAGFTDITVAGARSRNWVVRQSTNGGAWTQVDSFRYDSSGPGASFPYAVGADSSGNVYVVGGGTKETITGYSKNGSPIYGNSVTDWIVRKSANGDPFSTDDDYQYPSGSFAQAYALGSDLSGNMYVVGEGDDSGRVVEHGIIRSKIGGSWTTVDDFTGANGQGAQMQAFAADTSGNLYEGGADISGWLIRSAPGPTAPASPAIAGAAVFSSTLITAAPDPTDILHHRRRGG